MPPKRRRGAAEEPATAPPVKRSRRGKKEEEEEEEEEQEVNFSRMNVFDLKCLCKKRGFPYTGRKADLIARLEGKEEEEEEEKEEEKKEEEEEEEEKKEVKKAAPKKEAPLPEEYDFSQKRFVITGEFGRGKGSIIGMLTGKGAIEASAVSGTTSLCVLGKAGKSDYGQKTGPGTKKHKDAKKKKVLVVDEAWVIKICEGGDGGEEDLEEVVKKKWEELVEAMEKAGETKEIEPPATEEDLKEAEARLGYVIPAQYRALLNVTNGGFVEERPYGKSHSFPTAQQVMGAHCKEFERFYKALRMVSFGEYVHISGQGLVFEWDTSFDSQCGNTILADSVLDYLGNWIKQVEESGEAKEYKRNYETELEIDNSPAHKSFFSKFKSNYERCFGGRWPIYLS